MTEQEIPEWAYVAALAQRIRVGPSDHIAKHHDNGDKYALKTLPGGGAKFASINIGGVVTREDAQAEFNRNQVTDEMVEAAAAMRGLF
jgi:hypothetical protein